MTTIAITGATGQLGRLAIASLKSRAPDLTIIALARNVEAAADLGIPVRKFDYLSPDATALDGVDVLVLISSNDMNYRAGQHLNVITAAKTAGVGRIVYTSLLKGADSPMILAQDHIKSEAALQTSGLISTILRNGWYTENNTGTLGAALQHGAMIGSAGDGRISFATRADFAEAIAVVASSDGHAGKIYELAGDTAHTMSELAAEVSRQSGKTVTYASLPEADYATALQGFGLPEAFARVLADSDVQAAKGALFDDSRTLSRLIGRPTTPIGVAVADALKAL